MSLEPKPCIKLFFNFQSPFHRFITVMKRVHFKIEFLVRTSPAILYKFLTTPSCLVQWFCEEVDANGIEYIFKWEGDEQKATLTEDFEEELLRFEWEDAPAANEFLEFKITTAPITSETVLTITDYCDENEVNGMKQLWTTQVEQLQRAMGC